MERLFQTTDFRATLREYDFTRIAVQGIRRVVTAEDFEDMDSEKIFEYLLSQIQIYPFNSFLKRYIYSHVEITESFSDVSNEVYRRIIDNAFTRNRAPHSFTPTSVKRSAAIKRWLEQDSVQRGTVFVPGFGLGMQVSDVSEFLTKSIQEADFDRTDPWEMICRYCFENGLPYARAAALMAEYQAMPEGHGGDPDILPEHCDEKTLREWLMWTRASRVCERANDRRWEAFMDLYRQCQALAATLYTEEALTDDAERVWKPEDIGPADIERLLCDGIPRTDSGNLQKMSYDSE